MNKITAVGAILVGISAGIAFPAAAIAAPGVASPPSGIVPVTVTADSGYPDALQYFTVDCNQHGDKSHLLHGPGITAPLRYDTGDGVDLDVFLHSEYVIQTPFQPAQATGKFMKGHNSITLYCVTT